MRDEVEKKVRGYRDRRSIVRPDGSEKLFGRDWKKRKEQLLERSGGRCEKVFAGSERCHGRAEDPHHIKARSKGRDDRIENLIAVCRTCHSALDWKKLYWRKTSARPQP